MSGPDMESGAPRAIVYLGLGSNIGDRAAHIDDALAALSADEDIELLESSPIFESEYVGPGEQKPYLNACARISTRLAPGDLLTCLKAREAAAGRGPDSHMQPRTLDLDILLWNDRIIDIDGLVVPHPRLTERAFVLEPLCCLAPDLVVPGAGRSVEDLMNEMRREPGPWVQAWTASG